MKAIILAAGRGSRMGQFTEELPKCRTKLFGKELLQWQMESLTKGGAADVAIVTGYLPETFGFPTSYFHNADWHRSSMVTSLLSAKSWLMGSECIISYSDIVYSPTAVQTLIQAEGDIVLLYDEDWERLWKLRFDDPLEDAENFQIADGTVTKIGGKAKDIRCIQGQFIGLIKVTAEGWNTITNYLSTLSENEINGMDTTTLLSRLIERNTRVIGARIESQWYEVDSISDLQCYQRAVKHGNVFDRI